ncbi:hypothetical protein BJ970_004550 [Saccharopolyspora phatthalungensis]|uniref:Uncharacterized protein n=1 Tax=Saccharopolyspora phatthalungensis TaxID=664693 RepID=A0A840Q993_9PSEU|nr:hypothetical protein [Saccharopolyspora phatthalungensis]
MALRGAAWCATGFPDVYVNVATLHDDLRKQVRP